jgi:hypothetical protein
MIELTGPNGYWQMLLIAMGCGAVGGLAFELLQKRFGNIGVLEIPRIFGRGRFSDLGWIASVIIGAVTAVAVLYFLSPEVRTVMQGSDGTTTTTAEYDLVRLVALSLITGSAGPSFLNALQQKVLTALNAQEKEAAQSAGITAVETLGNEGKADLKTLSAKIEEIRPLITKTVTDAEQTVPQNIRKYLDEEGVQVEQIMGREATRGAGTQGGEAVATIVEPSAGTADERAAIVDGSLDELASQVKLAQRRVSERADIAKKMINAVVPKQAPGA